MQMTDAEICRSYREAKDKRSQVGVLAELNVCSKDLIREILSRNGIDAPKPGRKAVLMDKAKQLLKSEESEAPEADGSERKQPEPRVPDFVISIAVQKLEDMTKELNELMEYADTLKAQINELRHWISVATEGEENGTEESD